MVAINRALKHFARAMRRQLKPPTTAMLGREYWKNQPWPKQQKALACTPETPRQPGDKPIEIFYGGAAGGGKSDWLLMEALRFVHNPGYACLILRKNYTLLSKAGAIMDRLKDWLRPWIKAKLVRWNQQEKTFYFTSGAKIQFGYIERPIDWQNYQGTEYQTIIFDELTEFLLNDEDANNPYKCLFRSLRGTGSAASLPLRMLAASNPGNIGHNFVKARFLPDQIDWTLDVITKDGRFFVPARSEDNLALDVESYHGALDNLPTVIRQRLKLGDWDIAEGLIIPGSHIRYFDVNERGDLFPLEADGVTPGRWHIPQSQCLRFATIDTAGTSKDKAAESKGKQASWSVVTVFDYHQGLDILFVRAVWRERVGWTELKWKPANFLRSHNVTTLLIENAHFGPVLADELSLAGFAVQLVGPCIEGMAEGWQGAKLDRAIAAGLLVRLEKGQLLFQTGSTWMPSLNSELTSWSGHPDEQADQIDTLSYGSYHCKGGTSWGGLVPDAAGFTLAG
jgi:hypothetical protein